jgi:hypothetical protein
MTHPIIIQESSLPNYLRTLVSIQLFRYCQLVPRASSKSPPIKGITKIACLLITPYTSHYYRDIASMV